MASSSSSPCGGSDGAWILLCLARGGTYLRKSKPFCYFFEEHSGEQARKRTEGVEQSELEVVLRKAVDGEVGDPNEARVEECSEGVEDSGRQQVV